MASAVLQSKHLMESIAEFQHGTCLDMRPLLRAKDPLKYLDPPFEVDLGNYISELFVPLDAAITTWYNEHGHGRLFKLFACFPHMQLRVIAHALWRCHLAVLTMLPIAMVRDLPSYVVDFAAFRDDTSVLKYLHDVVGIAVSTPGAMHNAAQYGNLDVIRYLYELNHDTDVQLAVAAAARFGYFDMVDFFHTHCASCDLGIAFDSAVLSQDLVMAQYLLDLDGIENLHMTHAMDMAETWSFGNHRVAA